MKIRRLTETGREIYRDWLAQRRDGDLPPQDLLDGVDATEVLFDVEVDQAKAFANRFEFGKYTVDVLIKEDAKALLNQKNDGLWDWLTVAYFAQFGRKVSRPWHYTVTRRGHSGSLAYRHLARTAFEMYWRHGADSLVMLHVDMSTWGDLSEQLTSRQNVAYHRGYIQTAHALYLSGGRLRRGAASRVRPAARRKPGETIGRGGVARLALAVRRLCRTYDTHVLGTAAMLELLPREFKRFATKSAESADEA
jgi:hypothetical protein